MAVRIFLWRRFCRRESGAFFEGSYGLLARQLAARPSLCGSKTPLPTSSEVLVPGFTRHYISKLDKEFSVNSFQFLPWNFVAASSQKELADKASEHTVEWFRSSSTKHSYLLSYASHGAVFPAGVRRYHSQRIVMEEQRAAAAGGMVEVQKTRKKKAVSQATVDEAKAITEESPIPLQDAVESVAAAPGEAVKVKRTRWTRKKIVTEDTVDEAVALTAESTMPGHDTAGRATEETNRRQGAEEVLVEATKGKTRRKRRVEDCAVSEVEHSAEASVLAQTVKILGEKTAAEMAFAEVSNGGRKRKRTAKASAIIEIEQVPETMFVAGRAEQAAEEAFAQLTNGMAVDGAPKAAPIVVQQGSDVSDVANTTQKKRKRRSAEQAPADPTKRTRKRKMMAETSAVFEMEQSPEVNDGVARPEIFGREGLNDDTSLATARAEVLSDGAATESPLQQPVMAKSVADDEASTSRSGQATETGQPVVAVEAETSAAASSSMIEELDLDYKEEHKLDEAASTADTLFVKELFQEVREMDRGHVGRHKLGVPKGGVREIDSASATLVPLEKQRCLSVGILGPPNAGKSMLLNNLVGKKVAGVSRKTNTTMREILGVRTDRDLQLLFYDTPGLAQQVFGHPLKREARALVKDAWQRADMCDVILLVIDADRQISEPDPRVERLLRHLASGPPSNSTTKVLCLNKVDAVKDKRKLLNLAEQYGLLPGFDRVFMISGMNKKGFKEVLDYLDLKAKRQPWEVVGEDGLAPIQDLAMEVVREHLFDHLHQEIPYLIDHVPDRIKRCHDGAILISQLIYVKTGSQRSILIGKDGSRIRTIGTRARKELEKVLKRDVHLFLYVKLAKDHGPTK